MTRLAILAAALTLSACTTTPSTICTGSDLRRTAYTATIAAADAWTASGRPVPSEVMLARMGAVAALGLLNARCPVVAAAAATQRSRYANDAQSSANPPISSAAVTHAASAIVSTVDMPSPSSSSHAAAYGSASDITTVITLSEMPVAQTRKAWGKRDRRGGRLLGEDLPPVASLQSDLLSINLERAAA